MPTADDFDLPKLRRLQRQRDSLGDRYRATADRRIEARDRLNAAREEARSQVRHAQLMSGFHLEFEDVAAWTDAQFREYRLSVAPFRTMREAAEAVAAYEAELTAIGAELDPLRRLLTACERIVKPEGSIELLGVSDGGKV
jgi:vacuolar-type H+-ATPase subunit D/Vma8